MPRGLTFFLHRMGSSNRMCFLTGSCVRQQQPGAEGSNKGQTSQ